MNLLHFSENVISLRRARGMTQEQLADFVGVTKASVSKWETKQSLPDILMLPKLAACFDVTIDQLLGYEPQLSREQVQRVYSQLTAAFAEEDSFEETMSRSQELMKQYYNCYPLLFSLGTLWLNHFMLAGSKERQTEILEQAAELFRHVTEDCRDMGLCSDALIMEATTLLQLGRAEQVIEMLEESLDPRRLIFQSCGLLPQAYQMAGRSEDADCFAQVNMYLHLLSLMDDAVWRLVLRADDLDICEETIYRTDLLIETWQKEAPHPNMARYHFQAALTYLQHGMKDEALDRLQRYADSIKTAMDADFALQGDRYFDKLEIWIDRLDQGGSAPRSKEVIFAGALQGFSHPAFAALQDDERFQSIKKFLAAQGGDLK